MPHDPGSVRFARRSGDYVTRRIAGETIVVPIRAEAAQLDSVYVFNDVGARVWDLVENGRSADEVTETILREFDVTSERAGEDVSSFLALLTEAGLLEPGGGA
jgi:hypothetical protein